MRVHFLARVPGPRSEWPRLWTGEEGSHPVHYGRIIDRIKVVGIDSDEALTGRQGAVAVIALAKLGHVSIDARA